MKSLLKHQKQKEHGDYATPIAFSLAKILRKAPKLIAEDLVALLNNDTDLNKHCSFTTLNGYINITFSIAYIWEKFTSLLDKPYNYEKNNKNILLEYVSANPTGPLHIGHGRWAVIGSTIENLFNETQQKFKNRILY